MPALLVAFLPFILKIIAFFGIKTLEFLARRKNNRLTYDFVYYAAGLLSIPMPKPENWEDNPLSKVPEPKEPCSSCRPS